MLEEKRPVVKTTITEEVSQWTSVTGNFEAERYPGTPLLDTNAKIEIEFCITWEQKEQLMKDIAKVMKKYII